MDALFKENLIERFSQLLDMLPEDCMPCGIIGTRRVDGVLNPMVVPFLRGKDAGTDIIALVHAASQGAKNQEKYMALQLPFQKN